MTRKVIGGLLIVLLVAAIVAGRWLWTPDLDRTALEAKYSGGPGDFLTILGIRMHVRDTGPKTAHAVIMIHGLAASLHTWDAWAQDLSSSYRVICFDLPGAGLSGRDPTDDYTDTRSVQILAALMDQLEIARATVIGNSIGGRIAWRFAAQQPGRVYKLVLISPDGFESGGFEYGKTPQIPSVLKLMRYILPAPLLRMNLAAAYADPAALSDAVVTRYHEMLLAPGVRNALIERMQQTILEDPVPILNRIQAPTLLLWGEQDALIPFSNAKDYVRALPRGTLVPLPSVGHVPQEESPAESLRHVKSFLET